MPRDHEHPAIISKERLRNILGAIEIETMADGKGTIRHPAFAPELIEPTADIKIRLIGDYTNIDEVCCQTGNLVVGGITQLAIGGVGGQFSTSLFSNENYLNVVPTNKNKNYGFSGQVDWDLGRITVECHPIGAVDDHVP